MALIKNNNRYVKIYIDGTYEVYASIEDRECVKNATPAAVILDKYQKLMNENQIIIDNFIEKLSISSENFQSEDDWNSFLNKHDDFRAALMQHISLNAEYQHYNYKLTSGNQTVEYDYPIMANIFPDIKDSIPKIIESGIVSLNGETLEDIYNDAKIKMRFGETLDS